MNIEKAKLYKTAKAIVPCAMFGSGEFVSVGDAWQSPEGKIWFTIQRSERGALECAVCYPEEHLTEFCL